jgi:hypothetical protein
MRWWSRAMEGNKKNLEKGDEELYVLPGWVAVIFRESAIFADDDHSTPLAPFAVVYSVLLLGTRY